MLKKIKQKNEEILTKHFSEIFGEEYEVHFKWGFPICSLTLDRELNGEKTHLEISFDQETEDYQLSCLGSIEKDDEIKPSPVSISKEIINFVIKRTAEITEQFFTTREVPQQEEQKDEKEIPQPEAQTEETKE